MWSLVRNLLGMLSLAAVLGAGALLGARRRGRTPVR